MLTVKIEKDNQIWRKKNIYIWIWYLKKVSDTVVVWIFIIILRHSQRFLLDLFLTCSLFGHQRELNFICLPPKNSSYRILQWQQTLDQHSDSVNISYPAGQQLQPMWFENNL